MEFTVPDHLDIRFSSNFTLEAFAKFFVRYGLVSVSGVDASDPQRTKELCERVAPIHNTFYGDFWVFGNQQQKDVGFSMDNHRIQTAFEIAGTRWHLTLILVTSCFADADYRDVAIAHYCIDLNHLVKLLVKILPVVLRMCQKLAISMRKESNIYYAYNDGVISVCLVVHVFAIQLYTYWSSVLSIRLFLTVRSVEFAYLMKLRLTDHWPDCSINEQVSLHTSELNRGMCHAIER